MVRGPDRHHRHGGFSHLDRPLPICGSSPARRSGGRDRRRTRGDRPTPDLRGGQKIVAAGERPTLCSSLQAACQREAAEWGVRLASLSPAWSSGEMALLESVPSQRRRLGRYDGDVPGSSDGRLCRVPRATPACRRTHHAQFRVVLMVFAPQVANAKVDLLQLTPIERGDHRP